MLIFDRTIKFEDLVILVTLVGEHSMLFIRLYVFITKRKEIEWFLTQSKSEMFYRTNKTEIEEKILKKELRSNRIVMIIVLTQTWSSITFNIIQAISNLIRSPSNCVEQLRANQTMICEEQLYKFPFYTWTPYDAMIFPNFQVLVFLVVKFVFFNKSLF